MAWTTPKTWIDGELVTASLLNTQVRDNSNDVNTRLSTVEARTTETTTGNTQLGARLGTVEARTTNATTGNTQLGSRVAAVETRSTDNATLLTNHTGRLDSDHGRLTTLENRTTNATSGNTGLSDRLGTVESRTTNTTSGNTQLSARLSTVENRTTDAQTGNAALGTRVSSLETSGGGGDGGGGTTGPLLGGSWRLSNTSQAFTQAQNPVPRIPMNTTLRTPTGITNNNNGSWTITQTGWWSFSALCDINMVSNFYQEWVVSVRNYTQNQTIAADQFCWFRSAWTTGNAAGTFYCNVGDVIEIQGVFYIDTGAAATYYPISTARSGFTALYQGS